MNRLHRWYCRSDFWKQHLAENLLPWAMGGIDLGEELLEVGPGPGLTTDILRHQFQRVTSLEIDPRLATALRHRMQATNVRVLEGDASSLPFRDGSFSGAVAFTMLHHVSSAAMQDRLLAEVCRVLRPGGTFVGSDSLWSRMFEIFHWFDTMVVVDPNTLGDRLKAAGFNEVSIEVGERAFRFAARRPAMSSLKSISPSPEPEVAD
ncbi:MAG TPA: class I SAM-dependent methyltransferase [Terriglobia bacterium]|nr:class I SAM-dependent methyltransferase [Terriglobia bacterium]